MNPQHVPVDSLSESAPAETRRTGPGRAQIATAAFCFAVAFGLMVMLVTVPDLEGVWAVPVAAAAFTITGAVKLLPRATRQPDPSGPAIEPAPAPAPAPAMVPVGPSTVPGARVSGTSLIAVVTVAAASVIGVLIALVIGGGAAAQPVEDPGAVVRWGLPLAEAAQTVAAAVTIGSLVLAACALAPGHRAHDRAMDVAAVAAGAWALLAAVSLVLSFLSLVPGAAGDPQFAESLAYFASTLSIGQSAVLSILIAAIVTVAALLVRTPLLVAGVAVLAIGGGLAPVASTGHAAGSADHAAAVTAIGLHVLGASVWVGGLVVLAILRPVLGDRTTAVVTRYSALALVSFLIVTASGVVSATLRLTEWSQLGSPYGAVLLLKTGLLLVLGAAGVVHRRHLIRGLAAGGRSGRTFWRLVTGEVLLIGVASGLGAGLSRTPPSAEPAARPGETTAELLTGRLTPPTPSLPAFLTQWQGNLLWVLVCVAALVLYLAAVRRSAAAGRAWPLSRTISWCAAVVLLLVITNGAAAVYRDYLFSVDAVRVLLLLLVVPLLLALGRPVALLMGTTTPRSDGSRGIREWVSAARGSAVIRLLGQPLVAAALAGLSVIIYFFTPVLEWSLRDQVGRDVVTAVLLLVGAVLIRALGPGREAGRVVTTRMLAVVVFAVVVACVAGFLAVRPVLLAPDWYGALDQPWGVSPQTDQDIAAMLIDVVAVLFLLVCSVTFLRPRRNVPHRDTPPTGAGESNDAAAAPRTRVEGSRR